MRFSYRLPLLLSLLAMGFCIQVNGQSIFKESKNVLKINVLSPFILSFAPAYERAITDNMSVQLGTFYTGASIFGIKYRGFGITPELRYYFAGQEKEVLNPYVGPYLRYRNLKISTDVEVTIDQGNGQEVEQTGEATLKTFSGGIVVGGHFNLSPTFTLDAFLAPGIKSGKLELITEGTTDEDFDIPGIGSGMAFRTGLLVGIKF